MRFLVFSDLHLHSWIYGATIENGLNSRLRSQQKVLEQILTYIKRNPIDQIVFCGDFFHKHGTVTADVLKIAYQFLVELTRLDIPSIFLVGNHDTASKEADIHLLEFFKYFGSVVEEPILYNDIFWAISYTEDKDKLSRFLEQTPKDSVILMHQGVSNAPVNSKGFTINEILSPDMIPDHCSAAFTGHYHSHKRITNKLWIPGSTLQLTWNDLGEQRGILDVNYKGAQSEVKFVPLDSPRFVEILDGKLSESVEGNFVRIRTEDSEFKERVLNHGALSCEVITNGREESPHMDINDFSSLSGVVYSYMDSRNFNAPLRQVGQDIMEGKL